MKPENPVHDFGTVSDKQGPLSCEFILENVSDVPLCILDVTSSCGCTKAKWTRDVIKPGSNAVIKATFSNDEGPYPFVKSLSVRHTGSSGAVFLYMKGNVIAGLDNPESEYSSRVGLLRLKGNSFDIGHLKPLERAQGTLSVYNPHKDSVRVSVSSKAGTSFVHMTEEVIPPKGSSEISYSIDVPSGKYGYFADTLSISSGKLHSGRMHGGEVIISYVADSESSCLEAAPVLELSEEHIMLGKVSGSEKPQIAFKIRNSGLSPLSVHNIASQPSMTGNPVPFAIAAGGSAEVTLSLDLSKAGRGKHLTVIDIYTDSKHQAVHHVYVTYVIRPSLRNLFHSRKRGAEVKLSCQSL